MPAAIRSVIRVAEVVPVRAGRRGQLVGDVRRAARPAPAPTGGPAGAASGWPAGAPGGRRSAPTARGRTRRTASATGGGPRACRRPAPWPRPPAHGAGAPPGHAPPALADHRGPGRRSPVPTVRAVTGRPAPGARDVRPPPAGAAGRRPGWPVGPRPRPAPWRHRRPARPARPAPAELVHRIPLGSGRRPEPDPAARVGPGPSLPTSRPPPDRRSLPWRAEPVPADRVAPRAPAALPRTPEPPVRSAGGAACDPPRSLAGAGTRGSRRCHVPSVPGRAGGPPAVLHGRATAADRDRGRHLPLSRPCDPPAPPDLPPPVRRRSQPAPSGPALVAARGRRPAAVVILASGCVDTATPPAGPICPAQPMPLAPRRHASEKARGRPGRHHLPGRHRTGRLRS